MTIEASYSGVTILETMKEAVNYNNFLLKRILAEAPKIHLQQPMIDFGAGTGTFAEMLSQQGVTVHCIEYDDTLRTELNLKLGYTTYKSPHEIPSSTVNYIYSLNVLEHIENDVDALKDLNKILDKNGLLYLYVPAFNILYSSMDKKVGHFRRYRHRDLKQKLKSAGFEIRKWQYVDSVGFAVTLLYRWIGDKAGNINPKTLKFYDRVLFPISRVFDFLLRKILGKNLEIIAVKI